MRRTPLTSRSRLSSRTFWTALIAGLLFWTTHVPAQNVSSVLTIDLDRLFAETKLGTNMLSELEARAQTIARENEEIETALTLEEQELTQKRAILEPEDFRKLADDFDQRVTQFREEQDEKVRQLNLARDEAQARFLRDIAPIISEIVRARGATVVIERRDVFLSAGNIDITEQAIQRLNDSIDEPSE